jgi:singapore isolate B (sub-type 7) whole genome shotgun sequence assembly, scaffold_0
LSQELNLQNVELNLTSLENDLGIALPIVIKSSFAKSLKIVIPWTSLLSLPIGVYIENLNIELEDKVGVIFPSSL